jgi:hypothetical protein
MQLYTGAYCIISIPHTAYRIPASTVYRIPYTVLHYRDTAALTALITYPAYRPPPTAYRILHTAYCIHCIYYCDITALLYTVTLHTAYRPLSTVILAAYCILHTAYCMHCIP